MPYKRITRKRNYDNMNIEKYMYTKCGKMYKIAT